MMRPRGVDIGVLRIVVLRAGQRRLPLSLRWDDVHLKVIVNLLTRQPDDKGAVLFLTRSTESCSCSCSTKVNDEVMDVLAQPPILNCPPSDGGLESSRPLVQASQEFWRSSSKKS